MASPEPCCSFCKLPRTKVKNCILIPSKIKLDVKICIDCVGDVTSVMHPDRKLTSEQAVAKILERADHLSD